MIAPVPLALIRMGATIEPARQGERADVLAACMSRLAFLNDRDCRCIYLLLKIKDDCLLFFYTAHASALWGYENI